MTRTKITTTRRGICPVAVTGNSEKRGIYHVLQFFGNVNWHSFDKNRDEVEMTDSLFFIILFFQFAVLYLVLRSKRKQSDRLFEEIKKNANLLNELDKSHTKNLVHLIVEMTLLLKINATAEDWQKFTEVYHQLYFMGINKEILDDVDKLESFVSDLLNDRIIIENGESPFKFSFKEKK